MPLKWKIALLPCSAMNLSRSGCTAPVSPVPRDFSTLPLPSHFHGRRKRVRARGSKGAPSDAAVQVFPPSVETSTVLIVPLPDHAMPVIWWTPAPGSVIPCEGRVITDFTSIGYVNISDLPSL